MLNPGKILEHMAMAGPAWSALVLFLSSLVEYVFPPFPGDTITLAAAVLSGVYGFAPLPLFLALFAGSLAGTVVDYYAGRGMVKLWPGAEKTLERARTRLKNLGWVLVLFNRFFPGIRAFILVAAGMEGMGPARVLVLSGISALAWNALIFAAGWAVGNNFTRLQALFHAYASVFYMVFGLVVVIALLFWLYRRIRPK